MWLVLPRASPMSRLVGATVYAGGGTTSMVVFLAIMLHKGERIASCTLGAGLPSQLSDVNTQHRLRLV